MSARNNGGPAFPSGIRWETDGRGGIKLGDGSGGMTLRDYFAAKALFAIYSNTCWPDEINDGSDEPPTIKECAKACYAIADAMLAERDK